MSESVPAPETGAPAAPPVVAPPPVIPALPRALADPRPVIAAGTVAWLVAAVVVVVLALRGHDGLGAAVATCLVGVALGAIGYGIFSWQRRAVRSGSGRGQGGLG